MKRLVAALVLAVGVPCTRTQALQTQQGEAPAAPSSPAPWPVSLGLRVAGIQQKIPVQDRVVLVPDEAKIGRAHV